MDGIGRERRQAAPTRNLGERRLSHAALASCRLSQRNEQPPSGLNSPTKLARDVQLYSSTNSTIDTLAAAAQIIDTLGMQHPALLHVPHHPCLKDSVGITVNFVLRW